ncbi:diguanylate cyclase domain-containing protein [uncultured Pseudokineococcus sp.]|uniref:diguanylate cyclase domain-containing protein n=1 Tax=uncultured Pseudokineococcus sp. TaxID=1642928 RepID=UPI00261C3670|nr:diguanylate cyclase [uncultured Pseudokineococcus sp.]
MVDHECAAHAGAPPRPAGPSDAVVLPAELDLSTSGPVSQRLREAASRVGATGAVVADASGVEFCDCHGLGVLLRAAGDLSSRLVVSALAPALERLLRLTGTGHLLQITPAGGPSPDQPGPDQPGPDQPGPDQPGPDQPGPDQPGRGVAGGEMWPVEVVEAVTTAVEHLHQARPGVMWVATGLRGAEQVVVAAAGPGAEPLAVGTVMPWLGSPGMDVVSGHRLRPGALLQSQSPGAPTVAVSVREGIGVPLLEGREEVVGTLCGFTTGSAAGAAVADAQALVADAGPLVGVLGQLLSMVLGAHARVRGAEHAVTTARKVAGVDALTGLANRRGWQEAIARERSQMARQGHRAAVVALDIDGLKAVNDTYGHGAGDALLIATAQVLRLCCRRSDVLARVGGDEFVVLVVPTGPADLPGLTARIRAQLDQATVSASVAAVWCGPGTDVASAWQQADLAMYAMKKAHRTTSRTTGEDETGQGSDPAGGQDAPYAAVAAFSRQEGLLLPDQAPAAVSKVTAPAGADDPPPWLAFIHRARAAGLSHAQIHGLLALGHHPLASRAVDLGVAEAEAMSRSPQPSG